MKVCRKSLASLTNSMAALTPTPRGSVTFRRSSPLLLWAGAKTDTTRKGSARFRSNRTGSGGTFIIPARIAPRLALCSSANSHFLHCDDKLPMPVGHTFFQIPGAIFGGRLRDSRSSGLPSPGRLWGKTGARTAGGASAVLFPTLVRSVSDVPLRSLLPSASTVTIFDTDPESRFLARD